MTNRIESIDGWRAIAALGVLYTHVWASLGSPAFYIAGFDLMRFLNLWGNGVQLFFVISGFCFYLVLERKKLDNLDAVFEFWKKRWLRIAPAFYTVCTMLAFIYFYPDIKVISEKLFWNFIFLHNYVPGAGIDSIFWSLAVEWQFYLVLPFIFLAIYKTGVLKVTLALTGLCFLMNVLHYSGYFMPGDEWWYSLFANIGHFGWGILTAYLYKKNVKLPILTKNAGLLAGLSVAYLGKLMFSAVMISKLAGFAVLLQSTGPLIMTLGFSMMIYSALFNPFSFKLIGSRVLSGIGKTSYSFYLWHSAVLAAVLYILKSHIPNSATGVLLLMAIVLVILIPLSKISFNLLEAFYFKTKKG